MPHHLDFGDFCNNRCAFCARAKCAPETFTVRGRQAPDLRAQLTAARRRGVDALRLSGGEPTEHPDLIDIVSDAAAQGYRTIDLWTNGRSLSAPGVASELIAAGVTRFVVSLHGTGPVHDRLTGVPGAAGQVLRGLERIRDAGRALDVAPMIHSRTLVVPETRDQLEAILVATAARGATAHILEPFVVEVATLPEAQRFHLPLERVADAAAEAGRVAVRLGTEIRLRHLPPCLLSGTDGVSVPARPDAGARGTSPLHRRIERCGGCYDDCPGFRVEHRTEEVVASIQAAVRELRTREVVLSGLDLVPGDQVRELVRDLAREGLRVSLLTAGVGWGWRGAAPPGVAERVEQVFVLHRAGAPVSPGGLLVALPDLMDDPVVAAVAREEDRLGPLRVVVPARWPGSPNPEALARTLSGSLPGVAQVLARWKASGLDVRLVTLHGERRVGQGLRAIEDHLDRVVGSVDWSGRFTRPAILSGSLGHLTPSFPSWLW